MATAFPRPKSMRRARGSPLSKPYQRKQTSVPADGGNARFFWGDTRRYSFLTGTLSPALRNGADNSPGENSLRMILTTLSTLAIAGLALASNNLIKPMTNAPKANIVLVHGAFANASGWGPIISILEKDGYTVTAVENPLASLEGDVATTKRVIDAQKGPTVVVGHSYGGSVITGAAVGEPNVKALVYVAAYMPDAGETLAGLSEKFPAPPLLGALVPDSAGFLYVDRAKVHDVFCADLPEAEARIMAATQKPLHQSTFTATLPAAAWKTIPSWFVLPTEDRSINPDLHRFDAKRAGSKVTEIKASHCVFISHAKEVAKIIEEAAEATTK